MLILKYISLLGLIVIFAFATGYEENEDYQNNVDPEVENRNAKIAGGSETTTEKKPFLVQIRIANSSSLCCGSIITFSWVLTSADCVGINTPASAITVRAGTSFLDTGGTIYNAILLVIHGLYNATNYDYNFALVKINGTFTKSNNTNIIQIANQGQNLPVPLMPLSVFGWGMDSTSSTTYTIIMKEAIIKMLSKQLCLNSGISLTDRHFCGLKPRKGPCAGDDGCPVVYSDVLVGLITGKSSCGSWIVPSVFSAVNTVTVWIRGVAGN